MCVCDWVMVIMRWKTGASVIIVNSCVGAEDDGKWCVCVCVCGRDWGPPEKILMWAPPHTYIIYCTIYKHGTKLNAFFCGFHNISVIQLYT